jgi:cytochrome c
MSRKRLSILLALFAAVVVLIIASAASGVAGDARAGRTFAAANCAGCHSIGQSGESRNPKAPTFRAVARKHKLEDLEEAFAEGIVTGHGAMPEFVLTPRQIDDLLAHLRRLKSAPPTNRG